MPSMVYVEVSHEQTTVIFKKYHEYGLISRFVVPPPFLYLKKYPSTLFHSPFLVSSGHAALPLPACYLQIWCIRALNLPLPISCVFIAEVDGTAPVGPGSRCRRVNMLKSEGQRGWSQYWYHPWNHFVSAGDSEWPLRRGSGSEMIVKSWLRAEGRH